MSSGVQNFLVQGLNQHEAGDLFRARENYKQAIRLDPENVQMLDIIWGCCAVCDSLAAQKYFRKLFH